MKEIYKDYIPANARVVVDYTKKDKVKFSYPREYTYKQAVWKCAYLTVLATWFRFWVLLLYTIVFPIFVIYKIITYDYTAVVTYTTGEVIISAGSGFLVVFVALGIPAIVTWYLARDREKLAIYIPKLGKWSIEMFGIKKERKWVSKDIKSKMAVIPIFKNVYLDYKTTGEFSKYLTRIEIMEMPITGLTRKIMIWFKQVTKKEVKDNQYDWSAVFHFSKKPNSGELVVEYI